MTEHIWPLFLKDRCEGATSASLSVLFNFLLHTFLRRLATWSTSFHVLPNCFHNLQNRKNNSLLSSAAGLWLRVYDSVWIEVDKPTTVILSPYVDDIRALHCLSTLCNWVIQYWIFLVMAVSVGSLQPLPSSSCERPNTCGSIFRQYYPRQSITKLLVHLECRICCSIKNTHKSSFKKQYRQPFRSSTLEDAAITSWALYTHDNRTDQASNLPKPTSYNAESSNSDETTEIAADNQQATILVADTQGRKGRRNPRAPNPSLSISQSFDGQGNGGYIMQARGAPAAAMSKPFAGGVGLYMALVFALVGVTTAGASLLGINSSQEECTKCLGYGVERCHLCQCTGTIKFEGHFVRTIPCPLCLGSRMKKCSSCDGVRIKKGVPPFLQEKHAESSQKSNK